MNYEDDPALAQVMDLLKKRKEKQTALERVAQTQVTNQPWFKNPTPLPPDQAGPPQPQPSVFNRMLGRGVNPEQSRALNQLYGSVLNRGPNQTRIGAASQGFERGSQLIDEIRAKQKGEQMDAQKTAIEGINADMAAQMGLYGAGISAQKNAIAAMKAGQPKQVTFNGKVYNQYPDGSLVPLGASEGSMNRDADVAKEERKVAREEEATQKANIVAAQSGTASAAEVLGDVADIRKNLNNWTSGWTGGVGQHVWGSEAEAQAQRYDALKSKLAIDKLQQMRAAAANGASGFGNLTEKELAVLVNSIDTLSITAQPHRQREALDNIAKYYTKALADYDSVMRSAQEMGWSGVNGSGRGLPPQPPGKAGGASVTTFEPGGTYTYDPATGGFK